MKGLPTGQGQGLHFFFKILSNLCRFYKNIPGSKHTAKASSRGPSMEVRIYLSRTCYTPGLRLALPVKLWEVNFVKENLD